MLATLEDALAERFGGRPRVVALGRRPSAYRTSFAIEELDVELADGTLLPMMFKDLSWAALDEGARAAKPRFLYEPRREIEVYRRLLRSSVSGPPTCYGARVEPRADQFWLFLERVPGRELYQVGDLDVWQAVARWLAELHTRFSSVEAPARLARVPLVSYDVGFYRGWLARALTFLDGRLDGAIERRLRAVAERYDRVLDRLLELPRTFIHGEFYASNVLVDDPAAPTRVCPVDWEQAAVGPALIDLAAHAGGNWGREYRAAIAAAYLDALPPAPTPAADTFDRDLDLCRLHLAFQWLGWAEEWTPPAEHAYDWAAEAVRLADELSL